LTIISIIGESFLALFRYDGFLKNMISR